jgi:hypothetical protein
MRKCIKSNTNNLDLDAAKNGFKSGTNVSDSLDYSVSSKA